MLFIQAILKFIAVAATAFYISGTNGKNFHPRQVEAAKRAYSNPPLLRSQTSVNVTGNKHITFLNPKASGSFLKLV
jgi:hypothetical protein